MICLVALRGKAGKNLTHQAIFHYTPSHLFLFKAALLRFDSYGYLLLRLDGEAVFRPHFTSRALKDVKAHCRVPGKIEFVVMR